MTQIDIDVSYLLLSCYLYESEREREIGDNEHETRDAEQLRAKRLSPKTVWNITLGSDRQIVHGFWRLACVRKS